MSVGCGEAYSTISWIGALYGGLRVANPPYSNLAASLHARGRDQYGPGSQGTLPPVQGAVAKEPTRGAGMQARPST